jgi:RNA-directed DNA polymerase
MGLFDWLFGKRDRGPVTERGRSTRDGGATSSPGGAPGVSSGRADQRHDAGVSRGNEGARPLKPAKPGLLGRLLGAGPGHNLDELARRLGMTPAELKSVQPTYRAFTIPKRSGGARRVLAPSPQLKNLQRRVLRRVLGRLRTHPAAMGFERGRSIVTHAALHAEADTVVRMDIQDFFPSTAAARVHEYFQKIGWNRDAARLLTELCTYQDCLPQGAPTSPRLSNLVNRRLDVRLTALARKFGAVYSRYADDLTFSLAEHDGVQVERLVKLVRRIANDCGYHVHRRKKLSVRRRHQRQVVTGLVVNDGVALPRETRRRLRAVEHHHKSGRPATLNLCQLEGWRALLNMVRKQAGPAAGG